jgi:hypothetical protein
LSIQKSIPCSIFYLVLAKKMLSMTWPAVADASFPLSWLHKSCGGKSKGLWNLFGRMPLAEHAMLFPSGRVPFALGFCYERAGCWLSGIDDIFLYATLVSFFLVWGDGQTSGKMRSVHTCSAFPLLHALIQFSELQQP